MNKIHHILLTSIILAGLGSCASEAPFWDKEVYGEGKILTSSLNVKVKTDEKLVRAESQIPAVGDFTIEFINPENPDNRPVRTPEKYMDMPEVVTLPVGTYQVKAYYGGSYEEGSTAGFNAPYYLGLSSDFTIEQNKIIDNIQPIECKLSNVKVSIIFDDELVKNMSPESFVEVKVGESSTLTFKADTQQSGFFKLDGTSTLVARFCGVVEGEPTEESKLYQNVVAGTHYKITFKLHAIDPNEPGNITPGEDDPIKVDASVSLEDLTGDGGENINPDHTEYLEDDRYPGQSTDPDPEEPGKDDPIVGNGPDVTCEGAEFDVDNEVSEMEGCRIIVKSESGLKVFSVTIDSDKLTPEELTGVGLTSELDLIEPGEYLTPLQNFGFLDKETDQKTLMGEKDIDLDLSPFLGLLQMLGGGTHNFILTIGDDSGTTVKKLTLITEDEEE